MAYHYSFADNEMYSATDVNNITKRLVTSGIEDPFADGVPYNLSNINEMGSVIYTSGVVPETVLTLKVVENDETTVTILPGTAFFEDGAVIEIKEGGHTLSKSPGAINYVYLKNDLVNANACYPVCSTDAPTGDFVLLAEILENGTIIDKRKYAMGKLPGYASATGYLMQINEFVQMPNGTAVNAITEHEITYDVGNNHYQYLLSVQDGGGSSYRIVSLYCFADRTYNSFGVYNASHNEASRGELYLFRDYYRNASAAVSLTDGKLTLSIKYSAWSDNYGHNFPIQLYLF